MIESERLSVGVRLVLNACACALKKISGCVDMDGCGQVRAGREVCWVEHQAVLGTDNQVADFNPR